VNENNILKLTDNLSINIANSDIALGKGLFETIELVDGKPKLLQLHLKRLEKSLSFFKMGKLPDYSTINSFLEGFLAKNNCKEKALKLIAVDDNLFCILRKFCKPINPVSICISDYVRFSKDLLVSHKTTSCFFNKNLLEEAEKNRVFDSIAPNEAGNVTDGGKTNIFIEKNGEIITPPVSDGCLPGIIRAVVVEKFNVSIRSISLEMLKSADKIFLTNSLIGIVSVCSIFKNVKKYSNFSINSFKI